MRYLLILGSLLLVFTTCMLSISKEYYQIFLYMSCSLRITNLLDRLELGLALGLACTLLQHILLMLGFSLPEWQIYRHGSRIVAPLQ